MLSFFATTSKGMEPLLAGELRPFAADVEEESGGVAFRGLLAAGYRACLWSRTASRVLLPLSRLVAEDHDQLYEGVRSVDWNDHLAPGSTLAVDVVGSHPLLTHSRFTAQRVKDAIVDQLRERRGFRPSVDTSAPDVRINVHLRGTQVSLAIDLAGESLHRRGYHEQGVEAPLKENLAAAILLLADWPALAAARAPFLDPMCGSGTLPIEAAMIAAHRAPGLLRTRFGFLGWAGHEPATWQALIEEARALELRDPAALPAIHGSDEDPRAVAVAKANLRRARLADFVVLRHHELADVSAPESPVVAGARGLLAVNPPYGERIGDEEQLRPLYERIGDLLRRRFPGWLGAVMTGSPVLARAIGLRPSARRALWNGPIECRLLLLPISHEEVVVEAPAWRRARERPSDAAAMLENRIEKNLRHLRRWARREDIHCFRVYDADLPEYAFAIDLYGEAAVVQEYAPPVTVDPEAAELRRRDARLVIPAALGLPDAQVFFKTRSRHRGRAQYEKLAEAGELREVREGGHRFLVNLSDYLDPGLFLDHRMVRALVEREARGRAFLNLFCYTATATVYAAAGGARSTTGVDLSNTYLDWAQRNLSLNGFGGPAHRLVQADVLEWLPLQRRGYGLILVAPPTFSSSTRMKGTFDVQRDHVALLRDAAARLERGGVILFSAPRRRFRLDEGALPELRVEDLSARTLPPDFARAASSHHVFRLTVAGPAPTLQP